MGSRVVWTASSDWEGPRRPTQTHHGLLRRLNPGGPKSEDSGIPSFVFGEKDKVPTFVYKSFGRGLEDDCSPFGPTVRWDTRSAPWMNRRVDLLGSPEVPPGD